MTVVALGSIKGSPGVTTAATAIAANWPAGRKVLLVEADPFGGDLAPRYGSTVTGGLASLFAAARRDLAPEAVWEHVHELPGGLPVLYGLTGVHQAMANEGAWPTIAKALALLDADVIVDVGRFLPQFAAGVRHVLDQADVLVVVCEPTLESIVHLRGALPGLVAAAVGRRLLVVPTATKGYSADDIKSTLQVSVGRPMPHDSVAAAALANRRTSRRLAKSRLLKWAGAMAGDLVAEETSWPAEPSPSDGAPVPTPAAPAQLVSAHNGNGAAPRSGPARSKWETR